MLLTRQWILVQRQYNGVYDDRQEYEALKPLHLGHHIAHPRHPILIVLPLRHHHRRVHNLLIHLPHQASPREPLLLVLQRLIALLVFLVLQLQVEVQILVPVSLLDLPIQLLRSILEVDEVLQHDGHSQIQQEIVADDDAEGEEKGGEGVIVGVADHVEQVRPTVDGGALENGEQGSPNVVELGDAPVELGKVTVTTEVSHIIQYTAVVVI